MTPTLPRLCLLGPPLWRDEHGDTPVPPERRHQLLALLAWTGLWHGREQLAALFWPDHDGEAARRNLRKVLHRLADLPGRPPLQTSQGAVRWTVATDRQDFDAALAGGDLDAAAALWRGEPLAELDGGDCPGFVEWLQFERQHLQARWRDALVQAADQALARQDATTAAHRARQALQLDSLDEPALCRLLQALRQAGDPQAARQAHERFAAQLHAQLGLAPAAATTAWLADVAGPSSPEPPQPPAAPARTGLPEAPPDFVGRQAELADLAAWLGRPQARWITVTGPGGTGKTHLLRQAAAALAGGHADGVVWVPLDDLRQADAAVTRVLQALGRHLGLGAASVPALATVQAQLAARRLLLVLDNLEQLPDAAAQLHPLGDGAPGLRILASSRERLGLPQEWLLPLAGLPWPAPEDADRAESFDAVRLFVQQAQRHQPRFQLAAERDAVMQLCQRTDGLPLALALAAVWTRHFSVADIARDLLQRTELLQDHDGQRPARHHSVAATLAQTWSRLQPAEHEALVALAVCRGSFDREAAQAVAGAGLALLAALVDKSMLRTEPGRHGARFHFHPLVQQWLLEQRPALPEVEARSQAAHGLYFLGALARFPASAALKQPAFHTRWQHDEANLAEAWRRAAAAGQADALAAGAVGLMRLHEHLGRWHEGLALLAEAEPVLALRPSTLGVLRFCQATLAFRASQYAQAESLARQALHSLRRSGGPGLHTGATNLLGLALWQLGRLAPAARCFGQALAQARALADPLGESAFLSNAALVAKARGRYDEALAMLEQAIAVKRAHAEAVDLVASYNNLGNLYRTQGRPLQAISTLQAGLAALGTERRGRFRSYLLANLALAQFDAGRPAEAEALCAQAHEAIQEGGEPSLAASVDSLLARIVGARGEWARAQQLLAGATGDALQRQQNHLLLAAAVHWAELLQHQGRRAEAAAILTVTVAHADTPAPTRDMARQLLAAAGTAAPAGAAPSLDSVVADILNAPGETPRT